MKDLVASKHAKSWWSLCSTLSPFSGQNSSPTMSCEKMITVIPNGQQEAPASCKLFQIASYAGSSYRSLGTRLLSDAFLYTASDQKLDGGKAWEQG